MPRFDFPYTQSTLEDISKDVPTKMQELHAKLQELGCGIIMTHDEWLIEAPEDKKDQVNELMQEYLKYYVAELLKKAVSVPLHLPVEAHDRTVWPEVMCACGKPLHYTDDATRAMVEEMIRRQGRCIEVRVGARAWKVPRHYIALHGLWAGDLPELAKALKFEEVT